MATVDNDLMRVYVDDVGRSCKVILRELVAIRRADVRYTDAIKPIIDAQQNDDVLDRKREPEGVPNPTMSEIKQCRAALNLIVDLHLGNAIEAQTNFEKKLLKINPFVRRD